MPGTDDLLPTAIIIASDTFMSTGRLKRHKIPIGQVYEQALIPISRIRERLGRITHLTR